MLELLDEFSASRANGAEWDQMLNLVVSVDNETLFWLMNNLHHTADAYRTVATEIWIRCLG